MMIKKSVLLSLIAGLAFNAGYSQGSCGTDVLYNRLKSENPQIATTEKQLEQAIQAGMMKIDLNTAAKVTAGTDDTTYYDIPIVVHVVHDYGAEYIKDDDIFDAVKTWSDVYMKRNADTIDVIKPFIPYIGNARIRLHLATVDPNGNPTKGITHERSYLTNNAGDEAKANSWPNNQYINIWFINTFSASHSGAAAYAYYPSSGAYMTYYDGIISLYDYVNRDKTIPHELGHVLNLQHTWGNTNNPNVACGDDGVDDTPPTMGHLTTGCINSNLYDVTCATNYIKNGIDYPDTTNAQNIMDYTYCEKMFTKGQTQRMRLALTNTTAGRNNLWSTSNLNLTGALAPMPDLPPVADFSVERGILTAERCYFLCANSPIEMVFRNRSWNDTITGISWTFSNGAVNPTSTSNTTVYNQFSQPGWVTVSLTATGNNSGNTTITDDHAVYIADTVAYLPGGYMNNFASNTDVDKWPMFNYYKNNFKWEWYNGAGYDDGASIRYRSFDARVSPANKSNPAEGDHDDVYTPAFNLSAYSGTPVYMNFYTAGSYYSGAIPADTMQIDVSTDCGGSWKKMTVLGSTNLINNAKQTTEYTPTSGQWKAQTIEIPDAYHSDKVFFRFRYRPGVGGNNFYLDKFGVSPYTTEVKEVSQNPGLIKIYPNPAKGDCKVAFQTGNDGKVNFVIRDITGKTIYRNEAVYTPNQLTEQTLSKNIFGNAGFYFVTVTIADKTYTQKLVIE